MKFEEVLPFMREGKRAKIIDPGISGGGWDYPWIVCTQSLPYEIDERWLALTRLNSKGQYIADAYSWGIPTWAVMSDKWEIIEE